MSAIPDSGTGTIAPEILAAIYSLLIPVIIVVGARVLTRSYILGAFGTDDGIMLLCAAIFITQCIMLTIAVHHGLGRHLFSGLTLEELSQGMKFLTIWGYLYIFETSFVKLSIGYSLLRLGGSKIWSYIIYTAFLIDLATLVTALYFVLTTCTPIDYAWRLFDSSAHGTCRSNEVLETTAYAWSGITIALDALFVILPTCMLWNLHLRRQAKMTVIFLLSLGFIACIATIIRLKYVVDLTKTMDPLYSGSKIVLWSTVECGVGMICSSLATLRPLMILMGLPAFHSVTGTTRPFGNSGSSNRRIPARFDLQADLESDNFTISEQTQDHCHN